MKKQLDITVYWKQILVIGFAVGVFCVWYFAYPQKLMAWEQAVLFIWDREYYQELTAQPWGLWIYLRSFIVQFFYHPLTGATVLALTSTLLLLLTFWLLRRLTPRRLRQRGVVTAALMALALLPPLGFCALFWHPAGGTDEERRYDYLLRYARWQEMAEEGRRQQPQSRACQCALRMLQLRTGQISEEAFFGSLGISDHLLSDRTSAYIMSDVYLLTGLVNMSQRAAFEAMESIEDFNKSGRALMRLTETNLITGHYEVALKYIALLEETIYYRGWARRMRALAEQPERIAQYPTLSKLQQLYQSSPDQMFY